jgi:hypothetical protein
MQTETADSFDVVSDDIKTQSPEAAQIAHNQAVLSKIEAGLVELENQIAKLDSLTAEATRLVGEVEKIANAEAELLRDESLSESTATKRLIEIRARADVLRARAKAAGEHVHEQTELTLELGVIMRRTLGRAAHEILQARQRRIIRLLDDLLGSQYDSGLPLANDFIAKASRPVVEAQQFANFANQGVRPTQSEELEALRSLPRTWFGKIKVFVDLESQIQLNG